MDEVLRADFFFLVTTIVVVVLGVIAAAVLWYALRIVRQVDEIVKLVNEKIRASRSVASLLTDWLVGKGSRRRRDKRKDEDSGEPAAS